MIKRSVPLSPRLSLSVEFSILMTGSALRRTSLSVRTSGEADLDLFRLDSEVGGLSGFLGQSEAEDDPEANASVQISLLGLPLRPSSLFSSLGQLMDLYWSGRTERLSSYLAKSIVLLDRTEDITLRWVGCELLMMMVVTSQ